MNLQSLRQAIRLRRQQLDPSLRRAASVLACQQITPLDQFKNSEHIAFYKAVDGEIDPTPLIEHAWELGKKCYLPAINPHNELLRFLRYQPGDPLYPNQHGILEPVYGEAESIAPELLQLVITPLLSFDPTGHRVGSGKGYYDRTFTFLQHNEYTKPILIGLAYEFQKSEKLEPQVWDIPLTLIATEHKLYKI